MAHCVGSEPEGGLRVKALDPADSVHSPFNDTPLMPRRGEGQGSRRSTRAQDAAAELRRRIAAGGYPQGARLPAEPRLAAELGVARTTLREALEVLAQQGLVLRRKRAGTIVTGRPVIRHSLESTTGLRQMVEASGLVHSSRDSVIRFLPAPRDVATELALSPDAPATMLERVRLADGVPIAFTIDYLAAAMVESATATLFPEVSLYDWLAVHCRRPVRFGVARVSAITASGDLAARLSIDAGDPIFALRQTDYTLDGRPVLHSHEYYIQSGVLEITVVRVGAT
jgi:GntR family transcriptional regulator